MYRKQILVGGIAQFVEPEIRRLCEENQLAIGALNVQEDHVRLFLSAEPRTAPSLITNTLKGITARQVLSGFRLSISSSGVAHSGPVPNYVGLSEI